MELVLRRKTIYEARQFGFLKTWGKICSVPRYPHHGHRCSEEDLKKAYFLQSNTSRIDTRAAREAILSQRSS